MRITHRGDYALKIILELSIYYGSGLVTIHQMAKRLDIPLKFLEQILLDLKNGQFIDSRRGKIGGYLLAKHPSQIKLGDVLRFVDGPIEPIACVGKNYSGCSEISKCVFRNIWQEVSLKTAKIVDSINMEDLAKKVQANQQAFVYTI